MKKKLILTSILLSISVLAFQTYPYAKRIRPFASTPVACQENEIGYNMTSHAILICTNSGYQALTTGGSGSFAPVDATYITKTANATLTNEFALGTLSTGILKVTTTSGNLSIAVASDFPADSGLPSQTGNNGKYLTTNGSVSSWNTVSSGITNSAGANVVTKSNGTNLVASKITDDGTSVVVTIGPSGGGFNVYESGGNDNFFIAPSGGVSIQPPSGSSDDPLRINTQSGALAFYVSFSGNTSLLADASTGIITNSASVVELTTPTLKINATVTAGGTTGAQTINKSAGSVNFAAAATSLVITNSTVTTSSIINCTVQTNDATLKSVQCVPTSGSFTMFGNAAATAETRVSFTIVTPQ